MDLKELKQLFEYEMQSTCEDLEKEEQGDICYEIMGGYGYELSDKTLIFSAVVSYFIGDMRESSLYTYVYFAKTGEIDRSYVQLLGSV